MRVVNKVYSPSDSLRVRLLHPTFWFAFCGLVSFGAWVVIDTHPTPWHVSVWWLAAATIAAGVFVVWSVVLYALLLVRGPGNLPPYFQKRLPLRIPFVSCAIALFSVVIAIMSVFEV
jgi:hypothetical protein